MTVKDFERLYDYGYWANRKLFAVLSQLTVEQFTRTVAGSYGSVRNTLVHMLSAEWGWLERCGGPARGPALQGEDFPTAHAVVGAWTTVENWMRAFLAELDDERLHRNVEFKNASGESRSMLLGEMLQHSANHAVHHRGQVALLLRMLGHAPGNFDLIIYDAERHGVIAW
jgi:uncharacterized damage-inducible protein DinB